MTPSSNLSSDTSAATTAGKSRRRPYLGLLGTGCLGALVLGACVVAAGFAFVLMMLRSSDAYQLALATAQRHPAVIAELGAPVDAGWFTTGSIEVIGQSGHADLFIPISGPRGAGTLEGHAEKAHGRWTFRALTVTVSGGSAPLDLLLAAPASRPTS